MFQNSKCSVIWTHENSWRDLANQLIVGLLSMRNALVTGVDLQRASVQRRLNERFEEGFATKSKFIY